MYPTLEQIKTFLGITGTEDDDYLTIIRSAVIDDIENYCARQFEQVADVNKAINVEHQGKFYVARFPLVSVEDFLVNGETKDPSTYKLDLPTGLIDFNAPIITGDIEIQFTGGFDPIPGAIDYVIYQACKDAYGQKDTSAAAGAIKSERVDGAATIAYFDAATDEGGGGGSAYAPPLIASYATSLDPYMSEHAVGAMF